MTLDKEEHRMKNTLKLAGILVIAIMVITCTPKKSGTETTQYDYSKILKGDLSDFAGTWVNGGGGRRQLRSDGVFFLTSPEGVRAYDFTTEDKYSPEGKTAYKWTNAGEDFGYMMLLFPVGVDIMDYQEIVPSDKTKVRLYTYAHDWAPSTQGVYYWESGITTAQAQTPSADTPKVRYVNSVEGLRVRNTPNINGERTGLLPHLAQVNVIAEDTDDVTIDNIKGKWVSIQFITPFNLAYGTNPLEGWVFNGYLTAWTEDDYQNQLNGIDFELLIQADNTQNIAGNWIPGFSNSGPGNYWTRYIKETTNRKLMTHLCLMDIILW
jgi:hypothetical protein